jgi:hypothetical protein
MRFSAELPSLSVPVADPTGHGTRIADILTDGRDDVSLYLAQVFDRSARTSVDAVARAVEWCVAEGVDLIHLSLGLSSDRPVLATSIARALDSGRLVVASLPSRGATPYPACYEGVIQGTGDARCSPGQWSALGPRTFGGTVAASGGAGASVGAAHVTRELTLAIGPCNFAAAIATLQAGARWGGPERRVR